MGIKNSIRRLEIDERIKTVNLKIYREVWLFFGSILSGWLKSKYNYIFFFDSIIDMINYY